MAKFADHCRKACRRDAAASALLSRDRRQAVNKAWCNCLMCTSCLFGSDLLDCRIDVSTVSCLVLVAHSVLASFLMRILLLVSGSFELK